jgi:hypothetical protein
MALSWSRRSCIQIACTAARRRITCATMSLCIARKSSASSCSFASAPFAVAHVAAQQISVAGISSLPAGRRSRKVQAVAQLELAHLAVAVLATTLRSRASVIASKHDLGLRRARRRRASSCSR